MFQSWHDKETSNLKIDADRHGPILDFAVSGFPKCRSTTLEANLGNITPLPVDPDICTPVRQTV